MLQKDVDVAGTAAKETSFLHGLHSSLLRKAALLKKRHVKACLKIATQHFEKPVTYWENVVWSDETQTEIIPTVKFVGGLPGNL